MNRVSVGVDLGGTSVKFGIFKLDGTLIKKWQIPTNRENNCKNVISDIAKSIRKNLTELNYTLKDCVGIGMGVPGPVLLHGYVEVCVNLGWKKCYPARELSDYLEGINVELGNDANLAALGETWQGGASGSENAVMVTLGTGVGGGVIMDGQILTGKNGMAGEIGHIHITDDENTICNCGSYGCLEQVASATGIKNMAIKKLTKTNKNSRLRKYGSYINAKNVLDEAKRNDEMALEIMDEVSRYLGIALSQLTMTIDPEVFVIGGGVSKAGDFLVDMIKKHYNKYTPLAEEKADIKIAKLGNDAGIYGAAKLVL